MTVRTIAAAAHALRAGELTAVALLDEVLATLDATEPDVHAYAHVDREAARKAAERADADLVAGRDRGPLQGVPVAVKDLFCTADMPTRAGSRVLDDVPPAQDATAVRALREAGAVLVGKHVTHEFALGQNVPPTRNAWALDHYPGGSSAGAGVSVAVGSSLAALGTDAGGSVRKPASLNGVVGLKPTLGRVGRCGLVPPSGCLDCVGPITRTVEDAAIVLAVLADAPDATTLAEPVPDYLGALRGGVEGLRLGVVTDLCGPELDPEVGALTDAAVEALARAGAEIVELELPQLSLSRPAGLVLLTAESGAAHLPWLRDRADRYEPGTRRQLQVGALAPAVYVEAARRARVRVARAVFAAFGSAALDAVVSPTLPRVTIPLDVMEIATDLPSFNVYTMPWSFTGLPALSVPCGFTAAGLPVGLQVTARPFAEATMLRIGHAYEATAAWWRQVPPISDRRALA